MQRQPSLPMSANCLGPLQVSLLAIRAENDYCTKLPLSGQPVKVDEVKELHLEDGEVHGDSTPP